jgi:hypothetical protein
MQSLSDSGSRMNIYIYSIDRQTDGQAGSWFYQDDR